MRDIEVRAALFEKVLRKHEEQPGTLVVEELGLRHGMVRVDVAVVNGLLHGYEIKSDADTLQRLPTQISIYSDVLDRATLIVGERHADKATSLLPSWWGVRVATRRPKGNIAFPEVQKNRPNPGVDPVAVAQLLWRSEVIDILRSLDVPQATLRKARGYLYRELAEMLHISELRRRIREALRSRENWRHQRRLLLDDDLLKPIPRS